MKILLVNTLYYPNVVGGAERSVQFLAEALVSNGHTVVIATVDPQPGLRVQIQGGVKVYYVGLRNIYWPFDGQKRNAYKKFLFHFIDTYHPTMADDLGRIIDLERPDVVHTNNLSGWSVAAWEAAKKQRLPIVHTIRDYYLMCPRSTMFLEGRNCEKQCTVCRLFSYIKKTKSKLVDVVVGNSNFILERHIRAGYFRNAHTKMVIHNAYHVNGVREREFVKSGPFRLGYIGRLDPTKGIELLLNVVSRMHPNVVMLSVAGRGSPTYEGYLRSKYKSSNIHFLGWCKPEEFFSTIDVLVVPSLWHEPLPRTIFESFAHGVPVIGSNRGGIPELIEEGMTGYIFDPDNPDSLESLITIVMQDRTKIERMSMACLKKAQQFRPAIIVDAYLRAYHIARKNLINSGIRGI